MYRYVWIAAVVMSALAWSAPAAGQDDRPDGAYANLSAETYVDKLRKLGMVELAEAYVAGMEAKGWEPRKVRKLLADLEVDKAYRTRTGDDDRRAHHFTRAAELYRSVVAEMEPTDYVELTEKYEVQFELLSTILDHHARIFVNRLELLLGGQADVDDLLTLIDEPIRDLEDLSDDVANAVDRINAHGAVPMREFVIVSPRLERLVRQSEYTLAWAYVYHARASSPSDEAGKSDRMMMLGDAVELARQFAEDDASEIKWQAALLIGVAQREQGLYDEAVSTLTAVGSAAGADAATRAQAMFEISRARAEQGRLDEAITKAKVYLDESVKLLGDNVSVNWLRLYAAMLRYHAHVQAAELAGSDDQRQSHLQLAQEELADFVGEYSGSRGDQLSIYAAWAGMYRDRTDYENFPSLFLLAKGAIDGRKNTDEDTERAREALTMLLARSDAVAVRLESETRAVLSLLEAGEGKTPEEAKRLLALAEGDMSHEQALTWVYGAVRIYDKLIAEQYEAGGEASITAEQRRTFTDAIKLLLSREDWLKAEPGLATYYFDLGWHTYQLAEAAADPAEATALYNEAIADYESMPESFGERDNTYRHIYSRWQGLELRVFLLLRDEAYAQSDEGKETARGLRKMLRDYANQARRIVDGMGESNERAKMIEWGSEADLRAAELTDDPLDNAPQASQELSGLPDKWPDAPGMVTRSVEREIRILIKRGLTGQAVEKMEQFLKDHPDEAEGLIALVVKEVRDDITRLRYEQERQDQLHARQQEYFSLASRLFAGVADLPIGERYVQTQVYAESLVEVDRPEEAKKHFQECKDYRQALGEEFLAELAREYTRKKDNLEEAERIKKIDDRREAIEKLKDEFLETVEKAGIDLSSTVGTINDAWDEAADADGKSADQQKDELAEVVRYLWRGYRKFYERPAPVDPTNDFGLARCMSATGDDEGAAIIYAKLISGIKEAEHPDLYWSIQLERVRCSLAAYHDDRERLIGLQTLLKSLRVRSSHSFGRPQYKVGFEQLEREVDKLLAQTPAPAE